MITIIFTMVLVLQEGYPKAGQYQLERLRARLQRRTGHHHGCPVIKKLGNASRPIPTTGTSKKKEEGKIRNVSNCTNKNAKVL